MIYLSSPKPGHPTGGRGEARRGGFSHGGRLEFRSIGDGPLARSAPLGDIRPGTVTNPVLAMRCKGTSESWASEKAVESEPEFR